MDNYDYYHFRFLFNQYYFSKRSLQVKLGRPNVSQNTSNSSQTSRFEFDLKVTCRFKNFELAAHAMCRHTTIYAHSLFNKNINLYTICS